MNNPFRSEWWQAFYAKRRWKIFLFQAAVFVLAGVVIATTFSRNAPAPGTAEVEVSVTKVAGETLWTCSMHPQIRQPSKGKCPICGMDLIPVAKSAGGMRTLMVSAEAQALMKVETVPVERKYVENKIRMVGKVDYDETRLGHITAWVAGRLDRLYVDYTGVEVKQGDHLVYIYSEQLYSTQAELIQAVKSQRERPLNTRSLRIDLAASAREKLRRLGLKDEQIAEIEKRSEPVDHITIYSPLGGIVIDKLKKTGERVALGERIYTIADLSQVWVHLDAYESDLPWVRYGQQVTVTTEAYPGEAFEGRIAFIQPVLNDQTRTVKVRVNVSNQSGKLKPEMFVHAVVRPRVAAGGKVMDPFMAGKWVSPMHPEIVKNGPGACDICGMPLVRAESLGFVAPVQGEANAPLIIPYSAALVTGTRAIVYVQLPDMPERAEPAFLTLSTVIQQGELKAIQAAFVTYSNMLDHPYTAGGAYAGQLWSSFADKLSQLALTGRGAATTTDAGKTFAQIEQTMNIAREYFAPHDRPTFEGREIVLGPRAGDYYLVRHGLQEGEMVVSKGNFKIDAEIQIQAKPSMMTPEGGGGGGHDHGGKSTPKAGAEASHAGHADSLPPAFAKQLQELGKTYRKISEAVHQRETSSSSTAFAEFQETLSRVDGALLEGHSRMLWKEFAMLLANDAVEGRDATLQPEIDRVYILLKGHMRRMREKLRVTPESPGSIERHAVPEAFQLSLADVWKTYQSVADALASDNAKSAKANISSLQATVAEIDDAPLSSPAKEAWKTEKANLVKILATLGKADDLQKLRAGFGPLSQEIGVLANAFGFGKASAVFELHCPMAFKGKGAVWYQANDKTRNPYFGSTMLRCADRVTPVSPTPAVAPGHAGHAGH